MNDDILRVTVTSPSRQSHTIDHLLRMLEPARLRPARESHRMHEEFTEERLFVTEILNDPAIPQFSVARCRVQPGVTTQRHALSVNEWYIIETGLGRMRLGDDTDFEVNADDCIQIPAATAQQITNTGDGALVFLCVCLPRFEPATYTSLET